MMTPERWERRVYSSAELQVQDVEASKIIQKIYDDALASGARPGIHDELIIIEKERNDERY